MNKNDLQTEIKALQEYRREAESLIEKINSVTKPANKKSRLN